MVIFLAVHFSQRAGPGSEILGKGKNRAAIYQAETGDDAIGGNFQLFHAEIDATVFDKDVSFPESPRVEKVIQAFPGCEFAGFMLLGHSLRPTHGFELGFFLLQFLDPLGHCFHRRLQYVELPLSHACWARARKG